MEQLLCIEIIEFVEDSLAENCKDYCRLLESDFGSIVVNLDYDKDYKDVTSHNITIESKIDELSLTFTINYDPPLQIDQESSSCEDELDFGPNSDDRIQLLNLIYQRDIALVVGLKVYDLIITNHRFIEDIKQFLIDKYEEDLLETLTTILGLFSDRVNRFLDIPIGLTGLTGDSGIIRSPDNITSSPDNDTRERPIIRRFVSFIEDHLGIKKRGDECFIMKKDDSYILADSDGDMSGETYNIHIVTRGSPIKLVISYYYQGRFTNDYLEVFINIDYHELCSYKFNESIIRFLINRIDEDFPETLNIIWEIFDKQLYEFLDKPLNNKIAKRAN